MKEALVLAALLFGSGFARAQGVRARGPATSPEESRAASGETIQADSSLVMAPAMVRLASGELVADLSAKNFRVTDNGVEQTVRVEPVQGEPIAMVVLMQTGGGAPLQFQNYRTLNALVTPMMQSGMSAADHRVSLVTFDSHLQQIWNFPPRVDGLKYAFGNPEGGDPGAAILDALNCGIGLLEHQPPNLRRVILLLSQARDDGSQIGAEQVLRRLGESNTTVYSISFAEGKKAERPAQHRSQGRSGSKALVGFGGANSLAAAELAAMNADPAAEAAALSGGERARLASRDDLERTMSVLAKDFANSYVLSFHPSSAQAGFHWIEVQGMDLPKRSTVDARSIYWRAKAGTGQ